MKVCSMALDVVAVSDCNGELHSSEFHVNFVEPVLSYAALSILGTHSRRNHVDQGRAFSTGRATQMRKEQGTPSVPLFLDNTDRISNKKQPNIQHSHPGKGPPVPQSHEVEPEWCDIFCNGQKCPEIISFIGPDDLLTFMEREKAIEQYQPSVIILPSHINVMNNLGEDNLDQSPTSGDGTETEHLRKEHSRKEHSPPPGTFTRTPSSAMLKHLHLNKGRNIIICKNRMSGTIAEFSIYLYERTDKIIIMDIDGTVTKSDVRGYVESVYLGVYNYTHDGIINFLNELQERSKCHLLYLTSRPISHIKETRLLLQNARDRSTTGQGKCLPHGPVFSNTETLMTAAYRELIAKNTVALKSSILLTISEVFKKASSVQKNIFNVHDNFHIQNNGDQDRIEISKFTTPFLFGIGNKIADGKAYKIAGVQDGHILIIDTESQIKVWVDNRMPDRFKEEYHDDIVVNDNIKLKFQQQIVSSVFQTYADPSLLSYLMNIADRENI